MPRKSPDVTELQDLCCPECANDLFRLREDGELRCSECDKEVEAERDEEDFIIH